MNKLYQKQYSPKDAVQTLERYYLPVLVQRSPNPNLPPPIHLLGVAGGVGTSTLASLAGSPDKLLDFAAFDTRRAWVSYLPKVILVTNYNYSSVLALQGVLQQWTNKQNFSFSPDVLGIATVNSTGQKITPAVKAMLNYVSSGIKKWDFSYVPQLQEVASLENVAIPLSFYKKIKEMMMA
jgi:hypothetical protein